MMRICPKCNKEIDYLISEITGTMIQYLSTDIQGDLQYDQGELEPNNDSNKYWCPECNEVLFTEEAKAIAFLKGE